ncbi:MAG TPA: tRNA (5-methylaminomethyl-2-thiouridine)(34)-methyltransferase MnmD [Parafilimonas sp.]|nr:tRNA (5-methylaminomethyl-2-thiouridine)(34)-methyltransferase MnmD [Parafilimonas sp.]
MNLPRIIQLTGDGSHTISIPELNITYHSKHGAIQESMHVFIKEGLQNLLSKNLFGNDEIFNILEVGFGTGLNAFLSLNEAILQNKKIFYQCIEPYPLFIDEAKKLNYSSALNSQFEKYFLQLHECRWDKKVLIQPLFLFEKFKTLLQDFSTNKKFHLIYFDAFDPNAQPEMWTENIFKKMFDMLYTNGMLVTYCSKGIVRRAMQATGFNVEKLKGPAGKREIVRAIKSSNLY